MADPFYVTVIVRRGKWIRHDEPGVIRPRQQTPNPARPSQAVEWIVTHGIICLKKIRQNTKFLGLTLQRVAKA